MICKYFLPFYRLAFHFLDNVLWLTKVFSFKEVQLAASLVVWQLRLPTWLRNKDPTCQVAQLEKKKRSNLSVFSSSVVHDFGVIAKNLLPNPRS